ncbi:ABC transporter ATP-binding protein [Algoriphagus sediminis]|uniref:ABC transporter ATP-binding protein n=1 Tax=Algoriphagus sediminis TaxID=3057113 RepID=A0ABT7YDK5_9BACT|nr:ABC transporter ATP-binding protein [Algoriphagus sediminis]MDN3204604.1 ABC transporter ATP-binding protein [Algoriphagus sediminis]
MLIAKNIHKSYGNLHVLKGVNLEIREKEVVSIVGSSGAGKSTLLHILGTLDKADSGNVLMNGLELGKLKKDKLADFRNSELGFIFQFHNLLPEFTAFENIQIPGLIRKTDLGELNKRVKELAEILGITHRLDAKPSEMSGGEQQRVAVARALINSPKVVLADEPSGNLDTSNAEALHQLFFTLRDELNQTFVIVTHNDSLADLSDRKVTMKDGLIV